MCLIIAQLPKAKPLPIESIRCGWLNNSDGAGFMYVADGKLHLEKPFRKLNKFYKAYLAAHAAHGDASHFVLHFRYATHGPKTKQNTHPHELAGGRAGLVHNGILPFDPPMRSDISDTVWFCQTVLGARTADMLTDELFGKWLAIIIGKSNKLVILDQNNRMSIVNESAGLWDGDAWYSNTGYKVENCYSKWTSNKTATTSSTPAGALTCDSRNNDDDDSDVWVHGNTNYRRCLKLSKNKPAPNYVEIRAGEWAHIDDLDDDNWKKYVEELDHAYDTALHAGDEELAMELDDMRQEAFEEDAQRQIADVDLH